LHSLEQRGGLQLAGTAGLLQQQRRPRRRSARRRWCRRVRQIVAVESNPKNVVSTPSAP
jgi:hypothetical protein